MFKKIRRRRRRKRVTFIQRFFRSIIAVVILSAFILGISLAVKETANLDPYQLVKLAGPLFDKMGVSTEQAGQVAGSFAERILKTNIAPSENYKEEIGGLDDGEGTLSGDEGASTSRNIVFRTAFLADSHNNYENLKKALDKASDIGVHTAFFLGDYTDFGVEDNLRKSKIFMDESELLYYSLPGDRDLYESVGPQNYYNVFGEPRVSVTIGDIKFVLLDNSANYTVIDSVKIGQFVEEIKEADFVVMSQPLYHPLASYGKPVMGLVKGEVVGDVKEQAEILLDEIRDSDVKAVLAADHHSFSSYRDAVKDDLEHVVVGPVTDVRAEQKKASITLLSVFDDGSYNLEEVYLD